MATPYKTAKSASSQEDGLPRYNSGLVYVRSRFTQRMLAIIAIIATLALMSTYYRIEKVSNKSKIAFVAAWVPHKVKLPAYYDQTEHLASRPKANSTLGFQDIFIIGLKNREDKRDYNALMAHESGLKVNFVEVYPYDNQTRVPWHKPTITRSKLGAFRSHSSIWRKMLVENITTALILEDDIDWDLTVREQMFNLQKPLATLLRSEQIEEVPGSHIGESEFSHQDWDILRLGWCNDKPLTLENHPPGVDLDNLPVVSYDDVGVPFNERCWIEHRDIMDAYNVPLSRPIVPSGIGKRVIARSNSPVCLHAYALSNRGASRLLFNHNHAGVPFSNDLATAQATREGFLKSYSVVPTLFSQFQAQNGRDSDIEILAENKAKVSPFAGASPCLLNSTRAALPEIMSRPY